MQFDCLSDIHLESFLKVGTQKFMSYWEKVLSSQASDVLLIAGDVMPLYGFERMLTPWLVKEFTKRYSCIVAVLGNHDYYSEEIVMVTKNSNNARIAFRALLLFLVTMTITQKK